MDNNNSNTPDIDNSYKNTVEYNNSLTGNNTGFNQQIQVPVHQFDNQPKTDSYIQQQISPQPNVGYQPVAQQQNVGYQPVVQQQMTPQPNVGYQPVAQQQVTPQSNVGYQSVVQQPSIPQMGGYQPNPMLGQQFVNQQPMVNYQHSMAQPMQQMGGYQQRQIPQYQFNNRPMGNYQPTPQQSFGNQQRMGVYNQPPMPPLQPNNYPQQVGYPAPPMYRFNGHQAMGYQHTQMPQQFNGYQNINTANVCNTNNVANTPAVQSNLNVENKPQNTSSQPNLNMENMENNTQPNFNLDNNIKSTNVQSTVDLEDKTQDTSVQPNLNLEDNNTGVNVQQNINSENVDQGTNAQPNLNLENNAQSLGAQSNPYVGNNAQSVGAQSNPYVGNNTQGVNTQQQVYNENAPRIEYIPYIPGTPLPSGVTPQFINGSWYYPMTIKPKKKKMATSVKVFLGIIIGLTVLFTGLFFVWISVFSDDGGKFEDFFEFDGSFSDRDKDDDKDSNLLADPNGPEIVLEDNRTKDGSTEKAYDELSESVVSISVYDEDEQPSTSTPISEGTGIIISEDGYIVTNSHVILDDVESNVWITTKSGDVYPVGIVGCDVRTDLAVLKCDDARNWESASFADSDDLKVGQDVVAIGSPGGSSYSNSLTRGIVSALDRPLSGSAVTYIQTDAAINPGNSGGPLANMNGQVVGINTIKVVDTQYEGMGFAIPSVTIKKVADELIKNGYVTGRARLGVSVSEFSDAFAKYYDAEPGAKIVSIDDDSPLKDTKVKKGDIITEIDGKSVETLNELYSTLDEYQPGDTVELTIYRFDEKDPSKNKEFTVEIELLGDE